MAVLKRFLRGYANETVVKVHGVSISVNVNRHAEPYIFYAVSANCVPSLGSSLIYQTDSFRRRRPFPPTLRRGFDPVSVALSPRRTRASLRRIQHQRDKFYIVIDATIYPYIKPLSVYIYGNMPSYLVELI